MSSPWKVTAPGGRTTLLVVDRSAQIPAAFALMGTTVATKVAIRLAGGCKNMTPGDKSDMIAFFDRALSGYSGIIGSGGTRQVDAAGELDPMVTDVAGVVATNNKGCVALGTTPRVGDLMCLVDDSRLVLDRYGTGSNPSMSGILIVQNGADGSLDWDGDVDMYFRIMEHWQKYAGFTALGLVAWNGGAVTTAEIERAVAAGWSVFLVRGSGRATDEIIAVNNGEVATRPNVLIVDKNDPDGLHAALVKRGFIAA